MRTPDPLPNWNPDALATDAPAETITASVEPSAVERLAMIYSRPGPFASVYVSTRGATDDPEPDWSDVLVELAERGTSDEAIRAVEARLALPRPGDVSSLAIVAAHDGHTVVDQSIDALSADVVIVDTLPYAAPMLEWDQRRIPHLVVVVDDDGADIVAFHSDERSEMVSIDASVGAIVDSAATIAETIDAGVIVVGGVADAAERLAESLIPLVAPRRSVIVERTTSPDELAEATVRHVSNAAATTTVGLLKEFRFLAEHGDSVDGIEQTIEALRSRVPGVLLIHDDPADTRRVWLGKEPHDLSLEPIDKDQESARFVDAAIRCAVLAGVRIHITPTTGNAGPQDDAGVIQRGGPRLKPI